MIAGVLVDVATVPDKPFADVTDTLVTVPVPALGVAQAPSPRKYVVEEQVPVQRPYTFAAVAAAIAVPLASKSPVMLVLMVMAGVVVELATVPAKPLPLVTDTLVTVPEPPPPPLAGG